MRKAEENPPSFDMETLQNPPSSEENPPSFDMETLQNPPSSHVHIASMFIRRRMELDAELCQCTWKREDVIRG
jgi:hypothetical protein